MLGKFCGRCKVSSISSNNSRSSLCKRQGRNINEIGAASGTNFLSSPLVDAACCKHPLKYNKHLLSKARCLEQWSAVRSGPWLSLHGVSFLLLFHDQQQSLNRKMLLLSGCPELDGVSMPGLNDRLFLKKTVTAARISPVIQWGENERRHFNFTGQVLCGCWESEHSVFTPAHASFCLRFPWVGEPGPPCQGPHHQPGRQEAKKPLGPQPQGFRSHRALWPSAQGVGKFFQI